MNQFLTEGKFMCPNDADTINVETIEEGDIGLKPLKGQNLTVHYTGWLKNSGKKFDSSRDKNKPFHFVLGEGKVIRGWEKLFPDMTLGSRVKVIIPPNMAYRSNGMGHAIPECA